MKEMIAEALKENSERKEQLKCVLDWEQLDVRIPKKVKDRVQIKNFRACHFSNKKVKKVPIKNDQFKSEERLLSIVKEYTYEETEVRTSPVRKNARIDLFMLNAQEKTPNQKYLDFMEEITPGSRASSNSKKD